MHRTSSLRWLPFWTALAVALAFRLAFLDVRPLHHDEGALPHTGGGTPYGRNAGGMVAR